MVGGLDLILVDLVLDLILLLLEGLQQLLDLLFVQPAGLRLWLLLLLLLLILFLILLVLFIFLLLLLLIFFFLLLLGLLAL